jgi:hypothetical protein
LKRRHVE